MSDTTAASGQAGEATRIGSKRSGVRAYVQRANAAAVKAIARRDRLARKAA